MPNPIHHAYAHLPAAKAAAAFVDRHIVALNALALAAIVAFAALYIGQVNAAVSKGYVERDLQARTQSLTEENRRLELAVSRIQTLDHVGHAVKILGLVPAEQPTFLVSAAPAVALAK